MSIKTITVLGANGSMGTNVSGIFASFGNVKVYMVARSLDSAIDAKKRASRSVKAEIIEKNLIPMTYSDLEFCIKDSDLVFESLAEDIKIKQSVYDQIMPFLNNETIIATGTSGLSIETLSKSFSDTQQENFIGVHMFNPPYNMTLCELIPTKNTNDKIIKKLYDYLSDTLFRDVVIVKDSPAFMGNRIGFQFINECMQYAEKYAKNGGIDYIDYLIGQFTGRNMSPLNTADFVGLDIHKAIVKNVEENINDYAKSTFKLPSFVSNLILEGSLGRKTKKGLYQMIVDQDGNKNIYVYDIDSGNYRKKKDYNFEFVNLMIENIKNAQYQEAFNILINDRSVEAKITLELLLKYVIYSLYVSKTIGESIHSSDKVMSTGFNWIPPLALVDVLGGVNRFKNIVENRLDRDFLLSVDFDNIFKNVDKSKYDYRKFLKAK